MRARAGSGGLASEGVFPSHRHCRLRVELSTLTVTSTPRAPQSNSFYIYVSLPSFLTRGQALWILPLLPAPGSILCPLPSPPYSRRGTGDMFLSRWPTF